MNEQTRAEYVQLLRHDLVALDGRLFRKQAEEQLRVRADKELNEWYARKLREQPLAVFASILGAPEFHPVDSSSGTITVGTGAQNDLVRVELFKKITYGKASCTDPPELRMVLRTPRGNIAGCVYLDLQHGNVWNKGSHPSGYFIQKRVDRFLRMHQIWGGEQRYFGEMTWNLRHDKIKNLLHEYRQLDEFRTLDTLLTIPKGLF